MKKFEKDGRILVIGDDEIRLREFDKKNYSKLRFKNFMKYPSFQNIGVFMLPPIVLGLLLAACFDNGLIMVVSVLFACFVLLAALIIVAFLDAEENSSCYLNAELLKHLSVDEVFGFYDKSVEVSSLEARKQEAKKILEDMDKNSLIYADVEKKAGLIVQEYEDAVDELRLLENDLIEWSKSEELSKKEQVALRFLAS